MNTSAPETLSVSANIFIGQTEAPILVRPYIAKMTKSELATIMTGGFATAAGSVLALYVIWLESIPGIAGHLLAAKYHECLSFNCYCKNNVPRSK